MLGVMAVCATGGSGCGSKRTTNDGAAGEVAAGDRTSRDVSAIGGSCSTGLQDCLVGNKCDFSCDGATLVIGCRADDGGGVDLGMACGGTRLCKKGSGCFAAAASAGGNAVCRKYCSTDNDCPTGQCQTATITISCAGVASMATMRICF
jgi:hypothetical protein